MLQEPPCVQNIKHLHSEEDAEPNATDTAGMLASSSCAPLLPSAPSVHSIAFHTSTIYVSSTQLKTKIGNLRLPPLTIRLRTTLWLFLKTQDAAETVVAKAQNERFACDRVPPSRKVTLNEPTP